MSLTVATLTYKQDRTLPDAVQYVGPAHTFTNKDFVQLKRIMPVTSTKDRGFAKPEIKLTSTVKCDDGIARDVILKVGGSIPVGIVPADLAGLMAKLEDLIQLETAGTTKVFSSGIVTY